MTPLTGSTLPRGIAVGNLLAGRSTYLVRENALPDFFTFLFFPQLPLILYSYVLMHVYDEPAWVVHLVDATFC